MSNANSYLNQTLLQYIHLLFKPAAEQSLSGLTLNKEVFPVEALESWFLHAMLKRVHETNHLPATLRHSSLKVLVFSARAKDRLSRHISGKISVAKIYYLLEQTLPIPRMYWATVTAS